MRTTLFVVLVVAAAANDNAADNAKDILTGLMQKLQAKIINAQNIREQQMAESQRKIDGSKSRLDDFKTQLENAKAEKEGYRAKAKMASESIAEEKEHIATLKNDINALHRVLLVTETQTQAQKEEINSGLNAVDLAMEKVREMGSVPASLLQVLKPKIDATDFEALYQAKKGSKLGLLAKGGAAFTSSADVLMAKLVELRDEMEKNKQELEKDHTTYQNKRNGLIAEKTVEKQQAQERLDTLKADREHYRSVAAKAKGRQDDMSSDAKLMRDTIAAEKARKKQDMDEQDKIIEEATEEKNGYETAKTRLTR